MPGIFVRLPQGQMLQHIEEAEATRYAGQRMAMGESERAACRRTLDRLRGEGFGDQAGMRFCHEALSVLGGTFSLLEFGCGVGTFPLAMEALGGLDGMRYKGTDVREPPLAVAREACPGLAFAHTDLEDLPEGYVGGHDAVLARGVLCSCSNPFKALHNMLRCTCRHLLLPNVALADKPTPGGPTVTTLFVHDKSCYLFRLLDGTFFAEFLHRQGFEIVADECTATPTSVINWEGGSFRRHHVCAVRREETI